MAGPKRLVLFVEGEGDVAAVPGLISRIVKRHGGNDCLFVDPLPFRVKGLSNLTGKKMGNWPRFLAAALTSRANLGAVLLLLDGDCDGQTIASPQGDIEFCAATVSRLLASLATEADAGETFSVAVVFARQEFESWLIAGVPSLAKTYEHETGTAYENLEQAPRDAKGWIRKRVKKGYKPTQHQASWTSELDIDMAAQRLRSFRRLDNAVRQLIDAVRNRAHMVSPA